MPTTRLDKKGPLMNITLNNGDTVIVEHILEVDNTGIDWNTGFDNQTTRDKQGAVETTLQTLEALSPDIKLLQNLNDSIVWLRKINTDMKRYPNSTIKITPGE